MRFSFISNYLQNSECIFEKSLYVESEFSESQLRSINQSNNYKLKIAGRCDIYDTKNGNLFEKCLPFVDKHKTERFAFDV